MPINVTSPSQEVTFRTLPAQPPAYFLSLKIKNIRCFGLEQKLDLSDGNGRPAPWTIILGDNGFGKTTLLQCLLSSEPSVLSDLWSKNSQLVWEPKLATSEGKASSFKKKLIRSYPASVECSIFYGATINSPLEGQILQKFSVGFIQEDLGALWLAEAEKGHNIGGLDCYGYGATRRMGLGSLSSGKREHFSTGLFSDDAPLINAEEWYLQTDYSSRLSPSEKSKKQQEQIKEALINLLPDVEDIRIADSPEGIRVEVKTPFGWVHIQSLSLGYRTLIAWVVDLAYRLFERYPNSKNPLAEPAVVLVDEIDLHLHPRFQRTLMDYLTNLFPNTQFIATAHSPLVVQAASNANIALLRREGDHIVIDNDVEAIANWRIDQVLTSDLFGLESARPPQYDEKLKERTKILSKARLTKADRARLKELEDQIGELPTGETPDDIKAMDIIRQAAQQLTNGQRK